MDGGPYENALNHGKEEFKFFFLNFVHCPIPLHYSDNKMSR